MKIFVGCSSSNDIDERYINDSRNYLKELLKDNDLVFGASNGGIMGISYDIAKGNDRTITGICPSIYKDDLNELKCAKTILTDTINDRTNALINESDAIVFLPGGIGTIYELFAMIECKRNKEFDKPVIVYNSLNYFDKLFEFLDLLYDKKFTSNKVQDCYHISSSIEDTLKYLENYNKSKKGFKYE